MTVCEYDGLPLKMRLGEPSWKFRHRRFCGQACAAAHTRIDIPTRQCEQCGTDIPRATASRKLRPNEYARKRFCSRACATGTPVQDLPPVDVIRVEFAHFQGFKASLTAAELAARLHVPAWYVEQAVAS